MTDVSPNAIVLKLISGKSVLVKYDLPHDRFPWMIRGNRYVINQKISHQRLGSVL